MDLREHKAAILEGLRAVREKDENWGWSLRSLSKNKAIIRWGYLEYLGEKAGISIRVETDDGDVWLCARMDDRYPLDYMDDEYDDLVVIIGTRIWCDTDDINEGLVKLVRNIGHYARTRY